MSYRTVLMTWDLGRWWRWQLTGQDEKAFTETLAQTLQWVYTKTSHNHVCCFTTQGIHFELFTSSLIVTPHSSLRYVLHTRVQFQNSGDPHCYFNTHVNAYEGNLKPCSDLLSLVDFALHICTREISRWKSTTSRSNSLAHKAGRAL